MYEAILLICKYPSLHINEITCEMIVKATFMCFVAKLSKNRWENVSAGIITRIMYHKVDNWIGGSMMRAYVTCMIDFNNAKQTRL